MILACDVGGTKTNLALFEREADGGLRRTRLASYPSVGHASLDEIVDIYLRDAGAGAVPTAAGFGVAGPITGGVARITNLPWEVSAARLSARLGLPRVALLNDLEAHAWALERVRPADVALLQAGERGPGAQAVLAVGTGIGFSALLRGAGGAVSVASEGGHADYAPRGEVEVKLWRWLRARYGHVSVERVLSGAGLFAIHTWLLEDRGVKAPHWLVEAAAAGEGPAAVSAAAMEGRDPLCAEALDLFLEAYGAETGNWALRMLSSGGVYVGGGIAAKLLFPAKARPGWREHAAARFLGALLDKGRFRPFLERMPVGVLLDDKAALLGAAHCALLLAGG
jgi:glucokinase